MSTIATIKVSKPSPLNLYVPFCSGTLMPSVLISTFTNIKPASRYSFLLRIVKSQMTPKTSDSVDETWMFQVTVSFMFNSSTKRTLLQKSLHLPLTMSLV